MAQERKSPARATPAGAATDAALLERPLAPRSLVGSLLLGMRPPRLAAARLVQWCALFGVAEGTARVALSRMVDRGELVAAGGVYELTGPLRRRQAAQDWSLTPRLARWDGAWVLGIVGPGSRAASDRAALRDAGRRLRMVELREGVWTRPANLPRDAGPPDAWEVADSQCAWWTGRADAATVERARRLFEPERWADRARMLHGRLAASTRALRSRAPDDLADAFVVGAASLAHVRADPLLPAALCGRAWPGDDLRAAYRGYEAEFSAAVREWFRGR